MSTRPSPALTSICSDVRVRRTFCFVDLCGFTAFTESHGDRQAVTVLSSLRGHLRSRAEQHGVRITKWLGDGAMMSGVEAGAVLACALRVRADAEANGVLRLRGGVCEGDVIMFEGDDYVGAAVNIAARLCRLAQPGEMLLTSELRDAALDHRRFSSLGEQRLEGLQTPVQVYAATA